MNELDDAVKIVKQSRIERADYMHYSEHIAEREFFARNEGIEIGREQEKIAMIKKFFAAGTPINVIEIATGLSKEQIEGIIKAD